MQMRPLADGYSVSPQILPEEVAQIAAAGIKVLICNRPDGENPSDLSADAIGRLAEAAGLRFVVNPVVGGAITMENVEIQRQAIDTAEGPILAYCASGNRSSIVWALAMAGRAPTDDLVAAGAQYGYMTENFRPLIDKLAAS